MTEHVLGLIDGDAQQVPCHDCGAIWHNHFNFKYHGD